MCEFGKDSMKNKRINEYSNLKLDETLNFAFFEHF